MVHATICIIMHIIPMRVILFLRFLCLVLLIFIYGKRGMCGMPRVPGWLRYQGHNIISHIDLSSNNTVVMIIVASCVTSGRVVIRLISTVLCNILIIIV